MEQEKPQSGGSYSRDPKTGKLTQTRAPSTPHGTPSTPRSKPEEPSPPENNEAENNDEE